MLFLLVQGMCAQWLSCVQLFATLWTGAHQVPLSMEFSSQEYGSGLPFTPEDLPSPNPCLLQLLNWQVDSFSTEPPGKPLSCWEPGIISDLLLSKVSFLILFLYQEKMSFAFVFFVFFSLKQYKSSRGCSSLVPAFNFGDIIMSWCPWILFSSSSLKGCYCSSLKITRAYLPGSSPRWIQGFPQEDGVGD